MARYTPTTARTVNQINAELQKIKSAIDDTLSRKGDSPNTMESTLDMNSNRILNVLDAIHPQEPITLNQLTALGSGEADATLRLELASPTSEVYVGGYKAKDLVDFALSAERTYDTLADALADPDARLDAGFTVLNYYSDSNDDMMFFKWVSSGTGTPDGGSYINHSSLPLQAKQNFRKERVTVWQFGASRTNYTNNHTVFLTAMAYAKNNNIRTVSLGTGVFTTEQRTTIPTSLSSMEVTGENKTSPHQQGSDYPQSTWQWAGVNTGGVERVIECDAPWVNFYGFGVRNIGQARDFLLFTGNAIGSRFNAFTAILATGTNQFTRSLIHTNVDIGYGVLDNIRVQGAAPIVIDIDQGGATGMTPIMFGDRCFFETVQGKGPMTVLRIVNTEIDEVIFDGCTFNQPADELTIVDTTTSAAANSIFNLVLNNIEWDKESGVGAVTDVALKLKNVRNISIRDLTANFNGVQHWATLVNSNLTVCESNYGRACTISVFDLDSTSTYSIGRNRFDTSNVANIVTGGKGLREELLFLSQVFVDCSRYATGEIPCFRVSPTNSSTWEVLVRNGSQGWVTDGQTIRFTVSNISGGTCYEGTFGSQFRLSAAATAPANGKQITYTFQWDTALGAFIEVARSGEVNNT